MNENTENWQCGLWSLSSITCIVCTDVYFFLIQGNVTSLFWDFARSCFHMSVCQKFQPSTNIIKAQIVQNSFVIGLNIWRWSKFLLQWSPGRILYKSTSCDYLHNLLSRRGFQLLNRACNPINFHMLSEFNNRRSIARLVRLKEGTT